jgi:hypothetical protein
VVLSIKETNLEARAGGIVLVAHPEFGMGVEFLQTTAAQHDQVQGLVKSLRASKDKSPDIQVVPDGLETPAPDGSLHMYQAFAGERSASGTPVAENKDTLVELFRLKFQVPVEKFLEQMREQRTSLGARSHAKASP